MFIAFFLIYAHSILFPYTEKKNEWSISSEGGKGVEIFDFSFLGGILKKFTFKVTIIFEIDMFMFDFL